MNSIRHARVLYFNFDAGPVFQKAYSAIQSIRRDLASGPWRSRWRCWQASFSLGATHEKNNTLLPQEGARGHSHERISPQLHSHREKVLAELGTKTGIFTVDYAKSSQPIRSSKMPMENRHQQSDAAIRARFSQRKWRRSRPGQL